MNRIHLISGPRNISTALMYAFGNRADCSVVDEPFYAYYLNTHPDIDHPGRIETLASQSSDFQQVLDGVIRKDYPTDLVFFKNMAHHLDGANWSFMREMKNLFLIRNPRQLITSFSKVIPEPTLLDIGLKLEWELYEFVNRSGLPLVVLDSSEVLKNPEKVLTEMCDRLEIPFSKEMLRWEAGPRAEDGVWAKYWYGSVHQSTCFSEQPTSSDPFPPRLSPLLEEAKLYYERLREFAIAA